MLTRTDDGEHGRSRAVVKAAKECLRRSPYSRVRNVSCNYEGGVLVLRGRLPSFYHKQLAQEAVADIDGVMRVINNTEVRSLST
ncbi:MAG: BON domain-containing protein [Planctomycetota bacterium]